MRTFGLSIGILLLLHCSAATARSPEAEWDNRCEECHGDYAEFSRKYLWVVDGQLQGRHHIEDLDVFLRRHYLPAHQVEPINNMLAAEANSPARFKSECGSCHGELPAFLQESIWVRGDEITAMGAGVDAGEFLQTHQNLQAEDVRFYLKLFARVAR